MEHHNWWQFHTVLLKLGYRQVKDYNNEVLYYEGSFNDKIVILKSDKLDLIYTHRVLRKIGIDYKLFTRLYEESAKDESVE